MLDRKGGMSRRKFLAGAGMSALAAARSPTLSSPDSGGNPSGTRERIPLKMGLRTPTMNMEGDPAVFEIAHLIPGIGGIELQALNNSPDLWNLDNARRYKSEANRWGMCIPSFNLAWRGGASIRDPSAGADLVQAIRVAELLGASMILIAYFHNVLENLDNEKAYGPLVDLLQKTGPAAMDSGITLGMENSLSASENVKLLAMVDRPNVKICYDAFTIAMQGHPEDAVPGISILGKDRISEAHMHSNQGLLTGQQLVNQTAVLQAFNAIGYEGWFLFETRHARRSSLIADTEANIAFVRQYARMPFA